ncbi:alpha-glucosidase [Kibdelosporangium banguiense]|uniref:Alpha-glucosidase n=1 Tax=Kibdelosporangium banguiense TaxID=1365924 RepID=A0ABS4TPM0_9PSEU|nr:alpha-amylase family glycosyl hydrolase [Kibdelosporangium banguiense]MBP2326353.1 alpha-glucosidase [Kibdelosporangium banguiense]
MTWWREAVGYHVYLRSYRDSNGDGIGDLPGLLARLDHPRDLGADVVWISPFYPSPQADYGYDISDHRAVDPLSGTMSDVSTLVAEAGRMGLRLLADVVPNHTSVEHPWFRAGLTDRYHFMPQPPNTWQSMFGGTAWTQAPDNQWYLHLFAPHQPDLNWASPVVAEDFDRTLRFWLDRGFAGVRIDVAGGLAKDPDYAEIGEGIHPHWDRPEIEAIHHRWRKILDSYDGVAIGELWGTPERIAERVKPGQLHQVFQFDWVVAPWEELKDTAINAVTALGKVGALPTWLLGSHDLQRVASRYGLTRARAKALITFALPGSAWIYQGEELGLPDVEISDGRDPGGRDGVRVPMPWDDSPSFGFSPTGRSWLPQPAGWSTLTVTAQSEADDSTLSLYRKAIALRRHLVGRPVEWLAGDILAFRRGDITCALNTSDQEIGLPGELLLASGPVGDCVPPDTAVLCRRY